jgi:CHAD domain-containing protein
MSRQKSIWGRLRRTIRRAARSFRDGDPEGLHDLRVALRRTAVVAAAGERPKVARGAAKLVRRLSSLRQLEVDRRLVGELVRSGALAPEDARAVDDAFAALLERQRKRALERLSGKGARKLDARLGGWRSDAALAGSLAREAEEALLPPRVLDDEGLHRLRIAVKRRRYALMARRDLGVPGLDGEIARWESLQDALGEANDWRSLRRDAVELRERRRAESPAAAALDAVFDLASDRAEEARKAARAAVVESGLFPAAEPADSDRRRSRAAAVAVGSTSLLRRGAAPRADS